MISSHHLLIGLLSLALGLFSGCSHSPLQNNQAPAPQTSASCDRPKLWENDYATAWSVTLAPHTTSGLNQFKTPRLAFTNCDCTLIKKPVSGPTLTLTFKSYEPIWCEPDQVDYHSINPSERPITFTVIQFKPRALNLPDNDKANQAAHSNVLWENDYVWASAYTLPANTTTPMVGSRPDRILIASSDCTLQKITDSGEVTDLPFSAHTPIWCAADTEAYQTRNPSNSPIDFIVIQFKPGVLD